MILQLGSVQLRIINIDDIELLRKWRNDDKIRTVMFYQEIITPEMQVKWFESLSTTDFYFVIEHNDEKIGLINLCEDAKLNQEGEVGLYIHNESYWGGPIPVFASLALLQFAFKERNLQNVKAKVRKDNEVAQTYNEQLGFSSYNNGFQELNRESYDNIVAKLVSRFS